MIPELQRKLPPELYGVALRHWPKLYPPRCIRKYGRPEPDDIVIDVGAMYGEFAIPASYYSKRVHAFDPGKTAYSRISRAASGYDNIHCYGFAAGESNDLVGFDFSDDPSESMRPPEYHHQDDIHNAMVQMRRLDSFDFIDDVTFLKIDAEGYEPEVLDGLGKHRPKRVSIDVSEEPQRNPHDRCYKCLHSRGYAIRDTPGVLKGQLEGPAFW